MIRNQLNILNGMEQVTKLYAVMVKFKATKNVIVESALKIAFAR